MFFFNDRATAEISTLSLHDALPIWDIERLSVGVAVILLFSYVAGLYFSLKSHRHLFNPSHDAEDHGGEQPWSVKKAVIALALAGVAVGVMSGILVGSITGARESARVDREGVG